MKLRTKIMTIFIFSVIISIVVFLFAAIVIVVSMDKGNMKYNFEYQTEKLAENLRQSPAATEAILAASEPLLWAYPGMILELVSDNGEILYSSGLSTRTEYSVPELALELSDRDYHFEDEWIFIKEIKNDNLLMMRVPKSLQFPLEIEFSDERGSRLFSLLFFSGLGISIVVVLIFATIFTIGINRRFKRFYNTISTLDLDNLDINIKDKSRDELGVLARKTNEMANRLKEQYEIQRNYEKERTAMISNLSHDLRTPLTSIIGYSEYIDNDIYENEEDLKDSIKVIHDKAMYMEKLIGELLDFSRLEKGKLKLNKETTDLGALLKRCLEGFIPSCNKKGIKYELQIPEEKVIANVDPAKMERVVSNLIDNAIKYGSDGKYLGVSLAKTNGNAEISVEDHGKGIPASKYNQIFDRFYRMNRARKTGDGFGLGLSIVRQIVKAHGGIIELESQPYEKNVFRIYL